MSPHKEHIYCGTGKLKTVKGNNGEYEYLELLLFDKDVAGINDRFAAEKDSSFAAVKVAIKQRRTPSDKGATHYGEIDTWEPKRANDEPAARTGDVQDKYDGAAADDNSSVPF